MEQIESDPESNDQFSLILADGEAILREPTLSVKPEPEVNDTATIEFIKKEPIEPRIVGLSVKIPKLELLDLGEYEIITEISEIELEELPATKTETELEQCLSRDTENTANKLKRIKKFSRIRKQVDTSDSEDESGSDESDVNTQKIRRVKPLPEEISEDDVEIQRNQSSTDTEDSDASSSEATDEEMVSRKKSSSSSLTAIQSSDDRLHDKQSSENSTRSSASGSDISELVVSDPKPVDFPTKFRKTQKRRRKSTNNKSDSDHSSSSSGISIRKRRKKKKTSVGNDGKKSSQDRATSSSDSDSDSVVNTSSGGFRVSSLQPIEQNRQKKTKKHVQTAENSSQSSSTSSVTESDSDDITCGGFVVSDSQTIDNDERRKTKKSSKKRVEKVASPTHSSESEDSFSSSGISVKKPKRNNKNIKKQERRKSSTSEDPSESSSLTSSDSEDITCGGFVVSDSQPVEQNESRKAKKTKKRSKKIASSSQNTESSAESNGSSSSYDTPVHKPQPRSKTIDDKSRRKISERSESEEPARKKRKRKSKKSANVSIFRDPNLCDPNTESDDSKREAGSRSDSRANSSSGSSQSSSDEDVDDIFLFDRPEAIFGYEQTRIYEEQKQLTIDKLKELMDTLNTRPVQEDYTTEPGALKIPLMEHQRQALAFMMWREERPNPGGILADDMGLGKTAVTIALILSKKDLRVKGIRDRVLQGGTLIVAPASVIHHWCSEIDKFCHKRALSVHMFHGPNRETKAKYLAVNYDVVVTTYALLRDMEESVLMSIYWDRIILDEGHKIRNQDTAQAGASFMLYGKNRWVLSGTPIQNKTVDLFALFKFLRYEPFNNNQVWERFMFNSDKTNRQLWYINQPRLQLLLESIMLRRKKEELEESKLIDKLPKKRINLAHLNLSEEEMEVHDFFLDLAQVITKRFLIQRKENVLRDSDIFISNRRKFEQLQEKFLELFENENVRQCDLLLLLLRLRQITCHPALIRNQLLDDDDEVSGFDQSTRQIVHKMMALMDGSGSSRLLSPSNPVFDPETPSTKMIALLPILEAMINKGEKVILVSTFTAYLEIVSHFLCDNDIEHLMYTGKVSLGARQNMIKQFNDPDSEVKVMLLSMLAGNLGINLTGANNMFILDLFWNPQQEQQAMNRIHRFGQQKDVTIYKFICGNTIEQRIQRIQKRKLELAKKALDGNDLECHNGLSIEDMKSLFGIKTIVPGELVDPEESNQPDPEESSQSDPEESSQSDSE